MFDAFAGKTVSATRTAYQDPSGRGPMMVTFEFADGSVLTLVTDRPIGLGLKVPEMGGHRHDVIFEPLPHGLIR